MKIRNSETGEIIEVQKVRNKETGEIAYAPIDMEKEKQYTPSEVQARVQKYGSITPETPMQESWRKTKEFIKPENLIETGKQTVNLGLKALDLPAQIIKKTVVNPLAEKSREIEKSIVGAITKRPEEYYGSKFGQAVEFGRSFAEEVIPEVSSAFIGSGTIKQAAKIPKVYKKGKELVKEGINYLKPPKTKFIPDTYKQIETPKLTKASTEKELENYVAEMQTKKETTLKSLTNETKEIINKKYEEINTKFGKEMDNIQSKSGKAVDITNLIEDTINLARESNGVINPRKLKRLIDEIPVLKQFKDNFLDENLKSVEAIQLNLKDAYLLKREIAKSFPSRIVSNWEQGIKSTGLAPSERRILDFGKRLDDEMGKTYGDDYYKMKENYGKEANPLGDINRISGKKLETTILKTLQSNSQKRAVAKEVLPKETLVKFSDYRKLDSEMKNTIKELENNIKQTKQYEEFLKRKPSETKSNRLKYIMEQKSKKKEFLKNQLLEQKEKKRKLIVNILKISGSALGIGALTGLGIKSVVE